MHLNQSVSGKPGMKSFLALCCSLIAAVAASVAVADPFGQEMRFRPLIQVQSPQPEPPREAARPVPPRDMRAPVEVDHGRMNPDERRQLRRDIQNAGRDIYRPAPQPRRDAGRSGRR
jgi:hypothetical protein